MADLYSVITGIQPDQQDIIEAELLAKQILEANFPDLDLREGTGIRDLLLRPAAFLLALCNKGFDTYFAQNTLAGIDNTSSGELVDDILGNLFLSRNLGTQAVINVRLYFARQKVVTLTTSASFSTDGTLLFFPIETMSYPSTALQYDAFYNEWYLDVDMVAAEKGIEYNIGTGSLLYFTNFDPFFLRGEINFLSQASIAPETNLEFISRAESSISTRNLINKPSIDNRLRQDFNYLNRIVTIGAGDPEMFRDQVEVTGSVGPAVSATSMTLSDSNTTITVVLPNHGFVVGQYLNITESGSPGSPVILKRVQVSTVINVNTFKVVLPITVAPRALNAPTINPVEEDIYIHQGGAVDIHCGEIVSTSLAQFTLDSNGQCVVTGPVYKIAQSLVSEGPDPDTVPPSTPFTVISPGHTSRTDVTITNISGVITLVMKNHHLTVGRIVRLQNWVPFTAPNIYFPVIEVVDSDTVILDRATPLVGPYGTPVVHFVSAGKDTGFSELQELIVDFGSTYAGELVTLELSAFDNLESVQNYLEQPENRVVCSYPLARGFDIYVLDFDVTVYDAVAPSSGEVSALISAFLKTLPAGSEFILSDLVAYLNANGITKLKTPLEITYKYYTKDLFPGNGINISGGFTEYWRPATSSSIYLVGEVTTVTENP